MTGLSPSDAQSARELLADLLAVVDRHELAADGPLGRQLRAHLQGALAALDAVQGSSVPLRDMKRLQTEGPVALSAQQPVSILAYRKDPDQCPNT